MQGVWPHQRLVLSSIRETVSQTVTPFGRGAGHAAVLHLSKDSMDAAFRADVSAKEANQDRVLGLLLLACRLGLLLWVGFDFYRAWLVAGILSVGHIAMNAMSVRVLQLR